MPPTLSPRSRRGGCPPNTTGTAATSGQPMRRRLRTADGLEGGKTTVSANSVTVARAMVARLWRKGAGGGAMSLQEYNDAALEMAVRSDLAANPDFKLPPDLAFKS